MQEIRNHPQHGLECVPIVTHGGGPARGDLPITFERGAAHRLEQLGEQVAVGGIQRTRPARKPVAEIAAIELQALGHTLADFGLIIIQKTQQGIQLFGCGCMNG